MGKPRVGNPIHDCSFSSFNAGLKTRLSKDAITAALGPLIRKFADERLVAGFSRKFAELLKGSGKLSILSKCVNWSHQSEIEEASKRSFGRANALW